MNKEVPDLNTKKSFPNLILYGNLDGKEIIVINIDEMKVHSVISLTDSAEPYAIDRIKNSNILLSIARKYNLVEQIEIKSLSDNYKFDYICTQQLKHSPRTARGNEEGSKALISGANVALSTVLDLSCSCGEIILEVGGNIGFVRYGAACLYKPYSVRDTEIELQTVSAPRSGSLRDR